MMVVRPGRCPYLGMDNLELHVRHPRWPCQPRWTDTTSHCGLLDLPTNTKNPLNLIQLTQKKADPKTIHANMILQGVSSDYNVLRSGQLVAGIGGSIDLTWN